MVGSNYRPLPRIILASALGVGFAILLWRCGGIGRALHNATTNNVPGLQTNASLQYLEAPPTVAVPDPADTWASNVIVYSEHSTNFIDHDHFPFLDWDDPWKDMDPSEISQEEHERWLKEKREYVLQQARVGFAERQALWEKLKEEYDKN